LDYPPDTNTNVNANANANTNSVRAPTRYRRGGRWYSYFLCVIGSVFGVDNVVLELWVRGEHVILVGVAGGGAGGVRIIIGNTI
jgi:hypothetical protein